MAADFETISLEMDVVIVPLIKDELESAINKHPNFPEDMYQQLAILSEESGEVAKAVLHFHQENGPFQDIKDELIQTAAMCIRMYCNLSFHS